MADDVLKLSRQLGATLQHRGMLLSLAESCTGGMVAQVITSIAGSSAWFDRGFVTYSNAAKVEMLGVLPLTLQRYGAVSEQTAKEMALGALNNSNAHIAASITGIAGPNGGSLEKPVGTVCFALADSTNQVITHTRHFEGDREQIRRQATAYIITALTQHLLR